MDRRVSIEDASMRHGRKSKSYTFSGYKRHIATDLDSGLIVAVAVTPANLPEKEAMPMIRQDLDLQGAQIEALHIDRGYVASETVSKVLARGGEVICRPWQPPNGGLFTKADFDFDLRARTIMCPNGQVHPFRVGMTVQFDAKLCDRCPVRATCTTAALGTGRAVRIAEDEPLQHRLRKLVSTPRGRARLRERIPVEHRLAHIASRQGPRARYRGLRKNTFDLRRAAALQNLEAAHRTSPPSSPRSLLKRAA